MENTTQKNEFEFSLVDLLKIFKGKFKMLVAVGLIAGILGGVLGALSVTVGKKTYGNLLAFHFPTPEQTGYSTVIPLLESDIFTENILIGNEPLEVVDSEGKTVTVNIPKLPYTNEERELLKKYESEKLSATKDIKDYKNSLKALPLEIENLKSKLSAATNAYTIFNDEYNKLLTVYSEGLSGTALEKLNALENSEEYKTAKESFTKAQQAYDAKVIEQANAAEKLFDAEKLLADATEKENEIIERLRAEWRKVPENKELVEDFDEYVTYSFTKDGSPLEVKNTGKEDTTGKFIYINVEIPENIDLANSIIDNITAEIGNFVISNTTPVEKNDQIECIRISSGDAKDVNEDSLIKNVIIFAIIFFAVIEVVTCLIIICSYLKKNLFSTPEEENEKLPEGKKEETKELEENN